VSNSDQLSWDFVTPSAPPPKRDQPELLPFSSAGSAPTPPVSPAAKERKWYDLDDDDEIPSGVEEESETESQPAAAALDFETPSDPGAGDGLNAWRAAREEQLRTLASKRGLPIGHMVELTMKHGPVIKGRLLLADETLWINDITRVEQILFRIDNLQLKVSDIESCLRLD
jgi:hypothetical protein